MFSLFMRFWDGLSDEKKEKIIDIVVDGFEQIFRRFFQENKDEANNG